MAASCSMTSSVDARFELRVSCCWMVARCTVWVVATTHSQTEWTEPPRARSQRAQPHASATSPHTSWLWQTHMSMSLASHSITACNSVFAGRVLRSGTLLLLMLHVLSSATSCTVSCFRTISATLDTDFSSVALITVAFSVTACAVSDSTVIDVNEVSASSTTFRLRRV